MPGTTQIILTREERREAFLRYLREDVADYLTVFSIFLGITLVYVGLSYWIYADWTAGQIPNDCFDKTNGCQVLSVDYLLRFSGPNCSDVFAYRWSLPASRAVFFQEEDRPRNPEDCLLTFDIGPQNATFQPGTASCFQVKDQFLAYIESFNCARLETRNGSDVGACQTLLPPASTFDSYVAISLGSMVLFVLTYVNCGIVCTSWEEED